MYTLQILDLVVIISGSLWIACATIAMVTYVILAAFNRKAGKWWAQQIMWGGIPDRQISLATGFWIIAHLSLAYAYRLLTWHDWTFAAACFCCYGFARTLNAAANGRLTL